LRDVFYLYEKGAFKIGSSKFFNFHIRIQHMQKKIQALINFILFGLMIWINALANILPINGYNTGQVSAMYPNFFVPAGFTFSIWGPIYILLAGYVITTIFMGFSNKPQQVLMVTEKVNTLFQITCVLNAAWIVSWHYLYLEISLIIMIAMLVMLVKIYLLIKPTKFSVNIFSRLWIYHAFVVYLAWISVATIANTTALFVGIGWQGDPLSPQSWAIMLIAVALILGILFVGRLKEPAFGFVLVWAFFGIYAGQIDAATNVGLTAAISCCILLALTFTILIKSPKKS
ncbi:MAG: hypothetical protein ACK5AO_09305, partial [bacterium]